VSSSLIDAENKCDVKKYTIYTNVTRFIGWIKKVTRTTISSRMGEFESEESEEVNLWDSSATSSPLAANESYVDYDEEIEFLSEDEPETSTYEPE
jgi:hypothetical protein